MSIRRADFSPEIEPIEFGLSTARPTTPRAGRVRYETDTSLYVYYDGAAWQTLHATAETVQDTVGAMFSGNTETGITATYQDTDGTIDLAVAAIDLNSLTAATLAVGDSLAFVDDSDSDSSKKGLLTDLLNLIYPVDFVYLSYAAATHPGTLYGVGTWTQIARGEALVGQAASGTFTTVGSIGAAGAETVTLTAGEIPAHDHGSDGSHTHTISGTFVKTTIGSGTRADGGGGTRNSESGSQSANSDGSHTHDSYGGGGAHNNLQPSFVVYVWRRTS